jgi:hypothetical protein
MTSQSTATTVAITIRVIAKPLSKLVLTMTDDDDFIIVEVPEEWRQLGFTGLFWRDITLSDDVDIDEFEAKLPCMIPFGTNSNRLALQVNKSQDPPTVTVVWTDASAILSIATGRMG